MQLDFHLWNLKDAFAWPFLVIEVRHQSSLVKSIYIWYLSYIYSISSQEAS